MRAILFHELGGPEVMKIGEAPLPEPRPGWVRIKNHAIGINFADSHPDLRHGRSLGDGDWGDFSRGTFKGIGTRHFFSVNDMHQMFSAFTLEEIRRLSEASLMGGPQIEQLIVEALKPH